MRVWLLQPYERAVRQKAKRKKKEKKNDAYPGHVFMQIGTDASKLCIECCAAQSFDASPIQHEACIPLYCIYISLLHQTCCSM